MTPRARHSLNSVVGIAVYLVALAGSPASGQGTFWIADDVTRTVYEATRGGNVLRSFTSKPVSELAFDPTDDTLWAVVESGPGGVGAILQLDQLGSVQTQLNATDFGSIEPEGIAVDPFDGTLWVVDDHPLILTVFHIDRAGSLLNSFPMVGVDPAATSPQGIALDPLTETLWITDNNSTKVYNVTQSGQLLKTVDLAPLYPGYFNPQGVTVDDYTGTLWITSRTTAMVYNLDLDGSLLNSYSSVVLSPTAQNLTGIAFHPRRFFDLGRARGFTVLGLSGTLRLFGKNAGIFGDLGLGAGSNYQFISGLVRGTVITDPLAAGTSNARVSISGGTLVKDLAQAKADALAASDAAARLPADRQLRRVAQSKILTARPGLNVIAVRNIDLGEDEVLTLRGRPDDTFVFNVSGLLRLQDGARIELTGGLLPESVLFNVTDGGKVALVRRSRATGIVLAPRSNVTLKDAAVLHGALLAGGNLVSISRGARVLR